MPKRKSGEKEEERWQRKMKKYETKLDEKRKAHRVIYSSDEEHDIIQDHLYDCTPVEPVSGSSAQYSEYIHDNVIESQVESNSAIIPDPASHVVVCTADVHVDAEVTTPTNTDGQNNVIPATTSTNEDLTAVIEDYDPELLRALGEFEADTVEWGENIHEDIAKHFQHVLLNRLKKEVKEELNKKYLFPKNVPLSKAPTLNPEIAAMLTEASRNRDKRILAKQEQIGRALSGLGKAMTALLKKESNIAEVVRTLNDVGKLVADSHFAETDTRRSVVISLVDKSLIDPFKDRKRDSFLFGEKLCDLLKSSRGIKKTGQLIQAPSATSTSSTNLNWRAPPPRPRFQRGGQLPYPSRGGGHRGSYQARRRAPPAPAATARRQPPPPPPPRRQPAQASRPYTNPPAT